MTILKALRVLSLELRQKGIDPDGVSIALTVPAKVTDAILWDVGNELADKHGTFGLSRDQMSFEYLGIKVTITNPEN